MRLLSVLLGVGLMLGLSVFVMGQVDEQGKQTAANVGGGVLPGGIVVPKHDAPLAVAGNAIDAAQTVACATAAQTLRAAEDQYQVLNRRYADLPTLVPSGTVRDASPARYSIVSSDGFVTYRLVGAAGCPSS